MRDPRFAKFLERGLRVASARCLMGDDDATSDAHRFTMLLLTLLFNNYRPPLSGAPNSPWLEIVRVKTARLWSGDFEGFFREAHVQSARPSAEISPTSAAEARERAVSRAVDFGLNGSLSRSLRTLTGKGNLPLSGKVYSASEPEQRRTAKAVAGVCFVRTGTSATNRPLLWF